MAIDGGRLDEAFTLLQPSAATKHASGQRLRNRLITELINRAQTHLDHGRLQPAELDAGLAKQLGGQLVAVEQLICQIKDKQRTQAIHAKDALSTNMFNRLKSLVKSNEHEQTVKWLAAQPISFREHTETAALIAKPIAELKRQAMADFNSGRLDRCTANTELLLKVDDQSYSVSELKEQLSRCRFIAKAVKQSNFETALATVQQVQQVSPKAVWVKPMVAAIKQCQTAIETLHAGPLGLLPTSSSDVPIGNLRDADQPAMQLTQARPTTDANCQPALLQIDQFGGVLMLRGNSVSIGTPRIASDSMIVLQTDGLTSQMQISRDGEDYFVSSNDGLFVNDYLAKRHLLNHGDIITVGARGRLKFLRPVAASNSTILVVQGAKLKRRDIRGIALVDEAVVFGDSNCHFAVPNLPRRVIVRPDGSGQAYLIHEKGSVEQYQLAFGQSKSIADVSFTLLPGFAAS